jgi:glutaredoxin
MSKTRNCLNCTYCEKSPNLLNEKRYKCNYWKKDGVYELGFCGRFERKDKYE